MTSSLRMASTVALSLSALAACSKTSGKSGTPVARVGDTVITAEELKKRLDETSPFLRARYNTLDRKKEFLENMIKSEVLAQEARRRGLDKSPQVQDQMKRAMVQELIKSQLDEKLTGADIPEDELKKFYTAHIDEFVRPERARVFRILLPATSPKEKAEARKKGQKLLADINAREGTKHETDAFQTVARAESKDALSAPMGGDLRFLSKEEMAKAYGPELANAAFELKIPGEKAGPIETPAGIELVKLQVKTVAMSRGFDEAKDSIRGRMARERRSVQYEQWLKQLRESSNVAIYDEELDKVHVETAAAPVASPGAVPFNPSGVPVSMPPAGQRPQAPQPPTATSKIGGN